MQLKPPSLRPVVWLGDSKKNLEQFPPQVMKMLGQQLKYLQMGEMPKDAKPFKGVGSGVIELALKHDKEAYRCVQAVRLGKQIYVLHVFQKKSKKGIETPQKKLILLSNVINKRKNYQKAMKKLEVEYKFYNYENVF